MLFGRPVMRASCVTLTGCSLARTRASSWAPRSTAWLVDVVRVSAWNSCSTTDILGRGSSDVQARTRRPTVFVNAHAALRDPLRGRDGGARPRLATDRQRARASSSCRPRRSSCCAQPGQTVDGENCVRFDPEFILEQVAKAPREFDLQARNPAHNVHIGGDHMVFAPVYGCPFVREGDVRRDAKMADFENLVPPLAGLPRARLARAARSASRTTGRSTRATSTWSTRCRRSPTSPTWARWPPAGNAADTIAMTEILFGGRGDDRADAVLDLADQLSTRRCAGMTACSARSSSTCAPASRW